MTTATGPCGRPTEAEVFEVIRDAVVTVLEVPADSITAQTAFQADLHADSLALVEVVEIVEETLAGRVRPGFHIDDAALDTLVTVGDAVRYALAQL